MRNRKKYLEKQNILGTYARLSKITKKEFKQLIILARDKDPTVRFEVATILSSVKNTASKKILLQLACDRDALVRAEAYDSLSGFPFLEIENFLKEVIQTERDDLACAYAISSWTGIVLELFEDYSIDIIFMRKMLCKFKKKKAEHSILDSYYSLYRFGKTDVLVPILDLFESNDYRMRFAVFHVLQVIVNDKNRDVIMDTFERMLEKETALGVRKAVVPFWRQLLFDQALERTQNKKFGEGRKNISEIHMCLSEITEQDFKQLMILAGDKDPRVRKGAYGSLSRFAFPEIEIFLKKVIQTEKDDLACACAILSWSRVVLSLFEEYSEDIIFVKWILGKSKIRKSERCQLECYYALYKFGETEALKKMLGFFQSQDHRIYLAAFYRLRTIINNENRSVVIQLLEDMLIYEEPIERRKREIRFWKQLIFDQALTIVNK